MAVYNNFLKLEIFNRFAHLPGITGLMERLIGAVVFPHPTKMGRIVFPQNTANSTPPHQDYVHIHGATATYTCWMSLGDCPTQLGGLTIQVGSHRHGVFDYHVARAERDITGWGYGRTTGLGGDNPREAGRQLPASLPLGSPGLLNCSDHQPVMLNSLAALPPIIRDFSSSERISEWRI